MPIPGNNLRDNLFMTPVTEATYEQWWWQFIAEHEDWRYADSDALRKAAFEAGQESLRRQLSAMTAERDEFVGYAKDGTVAAAQLHQQLAAAQAAIKVKDAAFARLCVERTAGLASIESWNAAKEALAIQPDDSAFKAWLGEPFCYLRQTSSEQNPPHGWAVHFSDGEIPLYAPKGIK